MAQFPTLDGLNLDSSGGKGPWPHSYLQIIHCPFNASVHLGGSNHVR